MLKKGLAVAVILLFIGVALVPSITATDKEKNDNLTEPLDFGRIILRGFLIFPFYHCDMFTFFAIRVHYTIITGTERTTGEWSREWVTLPAKDIDIIYTTIFQYVLLSILISIIPIKSSI